MISSDAQKLFISVGFRSSAEAEPPPRASIQVMDLAKGDRKRRRFVRDRRTEWHHYDPLATLQNLKIAQ